MRLIAILLVLAVLVLLVALISGIVRRRLQVRRQQVERSAAWQDRLITRHDVTLIVVAQVARVGGHERVLNEIVMAEVATNDPEWTDKVRAARQVAAERAFELNLHSFPGPG